MEDKRTLLAFLLIGVILLLLPYYYEWMGLAPDETVPIREEETIREVAPKTEKPLSIGDRDVPSPELENFPPPISPATEEPQSGGPSFTPRQIAVRTPLQHLTFSTEGGILTSCRLTQYRRVDGEPVELIPANGRGLVLSLHRLDEKRDLSGVEFTSDLSVLEVPAEGQAVLRLSAHLGQGRQIDKVLTFYGDRYGFDLELNYRGFDEDTEAFLDWNQGIALTEKEANIDLTEARVFAFYNGDLTKIQLSGDDEEESWGPYKGALQWAGVRSKYFLSAIAPQEGERTRVFLRGKGSGSGLLPDYTYQVGIPLNTAGSWKNLVYLGPLDYDNLTRYGVQFEQAIDFGWPVVREISKFLLIIFKAMHGIIPNYGWIIILFAVVIKIIVYPLTHKTYESTAKMQELQPKISALREKYKNDQQRLSKETMKLYKEEGANPLGGCLPMILQMPIFFALYNLFGRTIELRQAPFIFWIQDLSLPDEIIIAGFGLHVLPFLMGISMLVQQKMTMKDPKQAFLVYLMPVMMIVVFWRMSSGLVLYWTIFNLLSIAQQVLINRFKQDRTAVPART